MLLPYRILYIEHRLPPDFLCVFLVEISESSEPRVQFLTGPDFIVQLNWREYSKGYMYCCAFTVWTLGLILWHPLHSRGRDSVLGYIISI